MIIEKTKQKFNQIKTRILFFFDEEKEYEEEFMNYSGDDFKVIRVNKNYFEVKYRVEIEEKEERILLYHPFPRPSTKGNTSYPLTDLLHANQELLIDEIAEILDRFGINQEYTELLRKYRRFVISKKYQAGILPVLSAPVFDINLFYNVIISYILEEKKLGNPTFNLIRIFEIMNSGREEWNSYLTRIQREELEEKLLSAIIDVVRIHPESLDYESMKSLFLRLKYNAITRSFPVDESGDPYSKLKITDEIVLNQIEIFFKEWKDTRVKADTLPKVLSKLGRDISEQEIFKVYGMETPYGLETHEITQFTLKEAVKKVAISPNWVLDKLGSWANRPEEYRDYLSIANFLTGAARFYQLLNRYSDFDFNDLDAYIQKYAKEIHQLDLDYRKAFTAYQKIEKSLFTEVYETVFSELNKAYDQYLIDLNGSWMRILKEKKFNLNEIKAPRQYKFYKNHVAKSDHKKVVIISDGFRYELGVDLHSRLQKDAANELELTPMVTSIPSYTHLGMSNLLPNDGIKITKTEKTIDYHIEGISTSSTNRAKILQLYEAESDTIGYVEFMQMDVHTQRELLKQNRILYIYHNWIDAVGDQRSSEYYTFESAEDCIIQLENLINRLYRSLNTYNILVTADHGFLFNHNPLPESSRQPAPDLVSVLKEHTRFYITDDIRKPKDSYLFSLSQTTNINSDVNVVLPKTINRYRKSGGFGVQFVHGGSSLQEIIVPVLEIYRDRRSSAKPVTFQRLDTIATMTSSAANFGILQVEPVDKGLKPIKIRVGIYDLNDDLITNEVHLTLDSVDKKPSGRVFEFRLELNALGAKSKNGYLKAFKEDDVEKLNPLYINDLIKISILTEIDEF